MSELKPCAHCGCEELTRSVNGGIYPRHMEHDFDKPYVVTCDLWCDSCGSFIQGYANSCDAAEDLYGKAVKDCYEKWNRRATDGD